MKTFSLEQRSFSFVIINIKTYNNTIIAYNNCKMSIGFNNYIDLIIEIKDEIALVRLTL